MAGFICNARQLANEQPWRRDLTLELRRGRTDRTGTRLGGERLLVEIAGRYELRGSLGKDGGAVFKAHDRMLDRLVAVKLFELPSPDSTASAEAIARFRAGAKAGARLSHPNIVPVFDYGETSDHAWVVMELVEGLSLRQILDLSGQQTLQRSLRLMEQILSALAYAHEHGVIHRDVKPSNILLTTNSVTHEITARLTDFGITRGAADAIAAMGSGLATVAYMAPEQFGGEADQRADIWAAGVIFYELLTGHKPFTGDDHTICTKIGTVDPKPPSQCTPLPPAIDAILAKALAKRPADRYASATEFAAALLSLEPAASPRNDSAPPILPPTTPLPATEPQREPRRQPVLPPAMDEAAYHLPHEPRGRHRRRLYEALGAGLGVCALIAVVLALNGDFITAQQPVPTAEMAPAPAPAPSPAPAATPAAAPELAFAPAAAGAAAAISRMDCALLGIEANDRYFSASGVLQKSSKDALLGTLDAFGLPQDRVQLDLQTFDADFCQVLQTIRPVAVQGDMFPSLALSSPEPLRAGQNLRFRVQTPERPTYLHVLFFGTEGQAGNMVQSDQPLPASSSLEFGEPYWTAATPYGTGLLMAITSDSPLYTERRPATEASSEALGALASAIQAAQRKGERVEARVITATSAPPQ
ncbi:serine/threonine-protein kinase [Roseomonas xinghualingensis]|uniref:serine/threonine-protein kinase n=1 Tax=Roseomonas xinghualingensis TaxID=2986475 RepID=UPI00366B13C3